MKIYDFSLYARRREERKAAQAVAETAVTIDRPGSVIELKQRVTTWLELHREVLRHTA